MRVALLVVIMILVTPAAFPQEPSVAKCREDVKTLSIAMRRPDADQASYFVWAARANEMSQCQDVDRVVNGSFESLGRGIDYMGLENVARVVMIEKLNNFIHRHGLQKQFIDDDQSGLR